MLIKITPFIPDFKKGRYYLPNQEISGHGKKKMRLKDRAAFRGWKAGSAIAHSMSDYLVNNKRPAAVRDPTCNW